MTGRQALLAVVFCTGCDAIGGDKVSVVEVPDSGMYAGAVQVEKRSYVAGIKVDTRSCSAPLLLTVDAAADAWFEMLDAACDLEGLEGEVTLRLEVPSGADPTGSPLGTVAGSVPEMTWSGAFWSDGAFEAAAATEDDGLATRTEWAITVSALAVGGEDAPLDSGLDTGAP